MTERRLDSDILITEDGTVPDVIRGRMERIAEETGLDIRGEEEYDNPWGDGGLDDAKWFERFVRCGVSKTTLRLIRRRSRR